MKYLLLFIVFPLLSVQSALAQQTTQTIRGTIRDEILQSPVTGASILVLQPDNKSPLGAITDNNGEFSISGVPIGRQTLRISSVGYEPQQLPNVVVTAGKEVVLTVTMTETVNSLNEVVVVADRKNDKAKTNNELSLVSGRSFNIDDTKRYAGALGDPSRMAANYAGVVSGNDSRNDIVVRGNSPTGMLWQLEGLNIPNPNHFGSLNSTGGQVSLLNNNVLDKSDFLTGAFPAQYGNALSGVFDLRLREGNNQKHEFLGQVGFNGFEVGAEGPLSKNSKASYLINYRYSTLGLFKTLGVSFGTGSAVPNYQDLNLKVFIPTGPKGKLSFFTIGGRSDVAFLGNDVDTTQTNLYGTENENTRVNYSTTIMGLSYEYTLTPRTFAKLTLGASTTNQTFNGDSISTVTRQAFASGEARFKTRKYSAVLNLRHKINAKSSLYGGITTDLLNFDLYHRDIYEGGRYDSVRVNIKGENTVLTQVYGQWRYRFSSNLLLTTGLHFQHYSLNNSVALEPRAGLRYSFANGQSLSLGYGLHSQAQNIYTYFVQTSTANGLRYTNKDLGFTRSHHVVLSYENRLGENILLKIEPYYQALFDVPVERRRSSFSALNVGNTFGPSDVDSLVNKGTGRNIGVELTLERYFNRGYYFLITTSLFDSKYKGSDGIERNTAFNTGYVVNVLAGREVKVGRSRTNVLSASIRVSSVGGRYVSPLNLEASRQRGEAVYNERIAFSQQQDPYFRTDLRLAYRKEMRKRTLEVAVDLQNVTGRQNIFLQTYNRRTNSLSNEYQQGFFPVPQVRYTF
jgi:hypothetical protein